MKAYEFQTKINKGIVQIPNNYLRELEKCQNVRVIILTEDESKTPILANSNKKLSELLLLPELEENELLFERDKDTGRDIIL
jgi:hypothetical protein